MEKYHHKPRPLSPLPPSCVFQSSGYSWRTPTRTSSTSVCWPWLSCRNNNPRCSSNTSELFVVVVCLFVVVVVFLTVTANIVSLVIFVVVVIIFIFTVIAVIVAVVIVIVAVVVIVVVVVVVVKAELYTRCRDLIVECLDDKDDSIRLRALDLIAGMVTKKTLVEIVKKLIMHMDQSESTSRSHDMALKPNTMNLLFFFFFQTIVTRFC